MSDSHLTELEIKLAYQEDLVQTLNSIVSDHQKQINRLEETCKVLNERIRNMTINDVGVDQGFEIPPHY